MPQGPPVFSIEVQNFVLVTYKVPAERVRTHLPSPYDLETFETPTGPVAFVSTTCFCNRDFRPVALNAPKHTFNESTYRTYVQHKGRRGVYFFGRYLGTRTAWLPQRTLARDTYSADFDIEIDRSDKGYDSYRCEAASSEGITRFVIEAKATPRAKAPFDSADALTDFITYRLHGFYTTSTGLEGYMPVAHPHMFPVAGRLLEGRFDLWNNLGILEDEEVARPYSVLVTPEVRFKLFCPRPLL
jgi:uncharacterized protein YqjF (DUF2071 family)